MKEFTVPVVMYVSVSIEAKNEDEAETKVRAGIWNDYRHLEEHSKLDVKVKDIEINP